MSTPENSAIRRALDEVKFSMPGRRIRSDSMGDGHFAASRGGRPHHGEDFEFAVGESVPAPMPCRVYRLGYCYENDPTYRLIEAVSLNGKAIVRLLYVDPTVSAGDFVAEGDIVGTAQDISARYGSRMTNHVHVEVFIDPSILKGGQFEESVPDPNRDPDRRDV